MNIQIHTYTSYPWDAGIAQRGKNTIKIYLFQCSNTRIYKLYIPRPFLVSRLISDGGGTKSSLCFPRRSKWQFHFMFSFLPRFRGTARGHKVREKIVQQKIPLPLPQHPHWVGKCVARHSASSFHEFYIKIILGRKITTHTTPAGSVRTLQSKMQQVYPLLNVK